MNEQNKQRDRPGFWQRWGGDLLLVSGAIAITVGVAMLSVPAGVITGGLLLISGGYLTAVDGGGDP